jgi:hypothetical protein
MSILLEARLALCRCPACRTFVDKDTHRMSGVITSLRWFIGLVGFDHQPDISPNTLAVY